MTLRICACLSKSHSGLYISCRLVIPVNIVDTPRRATQRTRTWPSQPCVLDAETKKLALYSRLPSLVSVAWFIPHLGRDLAVSRLYGQLSVPAGVWGLRPCHQTATNFVLVQIIVRQRPERCMESTWCRYLLQPLPEGSYHRCNTSPALAADTHIQVYT